MATIEQLSAALVKADAAGNGADAKVFADAIRKMRAAPAPVEPEPSTMASIGQGLGNLAAGAVRGAGSIGATLLAPYDMAVDAIKGDRGKNLSSLITGKELPSRNQERRQAMDDGLQSMGAEPDSWMYKGGKLATEIAGTAGMGGALAKGAALVPGVAKYAPNLLQSIASSGMTAGATGAGVKGIAQNALTRAAGGAITGSASAGLINPEDAGTGALVGGVTPGVMQLAGAAGGKVMDAYRYIKSDPKSVIARKMAEAFGMSADDLIKAVESRGPGMIPGYTETVPQRLQNPVASQLQRTLKTAGTNALGDAERVQQGAYRNALERVAPIDLTVQDAAARAGGAIESYAKPAYKKAGEDVTALFNAVDPNQAKVNLPMDKMEAARSQFLGAGTFGKGGASADQAIQEATDLMAARARDPASIAAGSVYEGVPFNQVQKLRSSIGEAITEAQKNGRNQAAAALTVMKNEIDNKVAAVAGGERQAGEIFTPEAVDAWGQSLAAHGAKKAQFETGPQLGMFRQGGDNQTAIQGAEIPGKFFSGRRSQVEDVKAFKNLIGNRADLADELKRYAVTEAASTSNAAGDLTSKYLKWLESRSGATRELLTSNELATLKEVGKSVERGIGAENLGRVSGSDTAQKLNALNDLGLLDSKAVNVLATRIPVVGSFTAPMLNSLRETAAQTRNKTMAQLLANPDELAAALKPGASKTGKVARLLQTPEGQQSLQMIYRAAPVAATR